MSKFVRLDLQEVFNHKAILENQELKKTTGLKNQGLGDIRYFYKPSYLPKSSEVITVEGVPFVFPDKSIDKYDNIECEEQEIIVPEGDYSKIHILGFSNWGSIVDVIKMRFNNDTSEDVRICILPWEAKIEMYKVFDMYPDCKVVIEAMSTIDQNLNVIYSYSAIKNCGDILKSLCLPDNICLHILSITLEG